MAQNLEMWLYLAAREKTWEEVFQSFIWDGLPENILEGYHYINIPSCVLTMKPKQFVTLDYFFPGLVFGKSFSLHSIPPGSSMGIKSDAPYFGIWIFFFNTKKSTYTDWSACSNYPDNSRQKISSLGKETSCFGWGVGKGSLNQKDHPCVRSLTCWEVLNKSVSLGREIYFKKMGTALPIVWSTFCVGSIGYLVDSEDTVW